MIVKVLNSCTVNGMESKSSYPIYVVAERELLILRVRAVVGLAHREQHDALARAEQLLERERDRDRPSLACHLGHHAVH